MVLPDSVTPQTPSGFNKGATFSMAVSLGNHREPGAHVHPRPLTIWRLVKEGVQSFIEDNALSRGAAIAFYAVTAIAPVLFIATTIAALVVAQRDLCGAMARLID